MVGLLAQVLQSVLLVAALGIAVPAGAETYRWVDERGVVTYSNTPPIAGKQAKKVVPVAERVTVYTPDAQLKKAMQSAASRNIKDNRRERELDAARRTQQAQRNAAHDRCVTDRRTDCELLSAGGVGPGGDPYAVSGYAPVYYVPRYVGVAARGNSERARPFVVVDNPVPVGVDQRPKVGIDNQPKVGINNQPKVGIDNRAPVGAPQRNRSSTAYR